MRSYLSSSCCHDPSSKSQCCCLYLKFNFSKLQTFIIGCPLILSTPAIQSESGHGIKIKQPDGAACFWLIQFQVHIITTSDLLEMYATQHHFFFHLAISGAQKPWHAHSPVERHLHIVSTHWRHECTCLKPIVEHRSIHVSCACWRKG